MSKGTLEGLRVLVVEDEVLIAMLIADVLQDAGCRLVGPVPRRAAALEVAIREQIDAAVLDVNLAGELVFPVADLLAERNIPFLFLTGYANVATGKAYAGRPMLRKPFRPEALLAQLAKLCRARLSGGDGPAGES
jgi:DNA-binding response OmpR family regulator